ILCSYKLWSMNVPRERPAISQDENARTSKVLRTLWCKSRWPAGFCTSTSYFGNNRARRRAVRKLQTSFMRGARFAPKVLQSSEVSHGEVWTESEERSQKGDSQNQTGYAKKR